MTARPHIHVLRNVLRREGFLAALVLIGLLHACFFPAIWGDKTLLDSAADCSSILPSAAWAGPPVFLRCAKTLDAGAAGWLPEAYLKLIQYDYLHEKGLPVWNPYQAYGVPLAADMQAQPFYPLTVILSFFPTPRTYNWFILLRLFLAGICAYFYLRLFVCFIPALAGSVASMLAGYYVIFLTMPHLSVETLLPAGLLAAEHLIRSRTYRSLLLFVIILYLVIVGGMPESSLLVLVFVYLYIVFRTASDPVLRSVWLFVAKRLVFATVAGVLLSAFLLVPFLEFMRHSWNAHQAGGIGGILPGLFHDKVYVGIFTYLFPLLFGPPLTGTLPENFTGLRNYLGVIAFFLSLTAILTAISRSTKADRTLRLLTCFFGFSVLLVVLKRFGFAPVNAFGALPLLNLVFFWKYQEVILSISVAVLVAIGLEQMMQKHASWAAQAIALGLTFIMLPAALLLSRSELTKELLVDHTRPAFLAVAIGVPTVLLFCLAMLMILCVPGRVLYSSHNRSLGIGVLVLLASELVLNLIAPVYYFFNALPTVSNNPYVGAPYIGFLKKRVQDRSRIFGRDRVLYPNWASAFQLFDIRNLDAMYYRKLFPFLQNFLPPPGPGMMGELIDRFTGDSTYTFSSPLQRRLLQLSSVKYLVTMAPYTIPNAMIDEIFKQNEGHLTIGRENYISHSGFILDGETRDILGEHPPYQRLPYRFKLAAGTNQVLHFSYGVDPAVFDKNVGDGVGFTLEVKNGSGTISKIFRGYIDPKHNVQERHWMEGEVDLSRYRGQSIELLLSTDPGPKGDSSYDWAAWSNFHVGEDPTGHGRPFKLVYNGEAKIYEYDDVVPRAAVYYRADIKKNEVEVLRRLADPSLDVFQTLVLDATKLNREQREQAEGVNRGPLQAVQSAAITSYRSQEVKIEASLSQSGILVLNDSDYKGWTADVDGHPGKWFTANYMFRGVLLGAGQHRISFAYKPATYRLGFGLTFFSLLFLLVVGVALQWTNLRSLIKKPLMQGEAVSQ